MSQFVIRTAARRGWNAVRSRPVTTLAASIAAIALLAGSLVVIRLSEETTREALTRLDQHAAAEAAAIDDVVGRATRDLRLASRNVVFGDALAASTGPVPDAERQRVESAITYMGQRYAVDEICLIRRDGLEVARFNGGAVAAVDDLSPDESEGNPAFAPTLGLADDTAHRTTAYVSPDSNRWVLGLATPIVRENTITGLLHFELPIAAMGEAIADPFGRSGYSFTVDRTGHLLTHPRINEYRAAAGLPVDADTGEFPPADALGTADWAAAIEGVIAGQIRAGTFSSDVGRARFAAYPILSDEAFLVTVSPESELFAAVRTGQLDLLVTVGPLAILMVLLSTGFARRLAGANRRLAVAVRSNAQLASIVQSAEDAILSVDKEGRIATWNGAAERTFGLAATAAGQSFKDLFGVDRREEVASHIATATEGEPIEHYEVDLVDQTGERLDISLNYSPLPGDDGKPAGASVIGRDISDLKRLEEQLAHQALHDSLTGMPNRALFRDRLDHALRRAGRMPVSGPIGSRTGVLFIDLDDFKIINDTLGHRIGDALLVAVGRRIGEAIRPGDTAARLGGDEFTVLLEALTDAGEARLVADRILAGLAAPFQFEGHDVVIGASIGIVLGEPGLGEPDDLLRSADTALYEAKGSGKGRHATYDPSMNRRAWDRLELEAELRHAIQNGELVVHYQPIVELATGAVTELEALVRWQHPGRDLVGPNEFVPLAEQTGLIVPIGQIVLNTACRDLATLRTARPEFTHVGVSVNMSPRELLRGELVHDVVAALEAAELLPESLRIEITEGIELEDAGAIERLTELRTLGVRVSIDDFGTGYSSLGSFRRLPIDGLKIDRSFVAALGQQREETAIVSAAVLFAGALGIGATGEGIETADQWRALRDLGCRYGQGYLLGRPAPVETIARMASAVELPDAHDDASTSAA